MTEPQLSFLVTKWEAQLLQSVRDMWCPEARVVVLSWGDGKVHLDAVGVQVDYLQRNSSKRAWLSFRWERYLLNKARALQNSVECGTIVIRKSPSKAICLETSNGIEFLLSN